MDRNDGCPHSDELLGRVPGLRPCRSDCDGPGGLRADHRAYRRRALNGRSHASTILVIRVGSAAQRAVVVSQHPDNICRVKRIRRQRAPGCCGRAVAQEPAALARKRQPVPDLHRTVDHESSQGHFRSSQVSEISYQFGVPVRGTPASAGGTSLAVRSWTSICHGLSGKPMMRLPLAHNHPGA